MPIISIGNYHTNLTDSELQDTLTKINKLIKYEVVVLESEIRKTLILRKKYRIYAAYYKTSDCEAEGLTGYLTHKEMKYFLEGLYIGWNNSNKKKLVRVK